MGIPDPKMAQRATRPSRLQIGLSLLRVSESVSASFRRNGGFAFQPTKAGQELVHGMHGLVVVIWGLGSTGIKEPMPLSLINMIITSCTCHFHEGLIFFTYRPVTAKPERFDVR